MVESFSEYGEVGVTDPLRQGDVLEAVSVGVSKWQRHLFVVTADCDFARGKHHGRVTCVPLLTAEEYLVEMWIPKIREQVVEKRMYELRELLARAEAPPISDNRLREWASEVLPAEIAEQLELQVSATGEN